MTAGTYCPLKLMTSRAKAKEGVLQMWGGFNADDQCDQHLCGFWSTSAQMCGIAAMGMTPNTLPNPAPMEEETEEDTSLLQPKVSA